MIADNLFRGGFDILHPQINWSADTTGVVGSEFPLLPLLAALLYKMFGVQDWIGRAIPVVFFEVSIFYFFLLVSRLSSPRTGMLATIFYAFTPLSIFVSRSFMPDAVSLSLAVIGLHYFLTWTDSMRSIELAAAAVLVSAAILVKLPYAVVLAPITYIAFRRFGWAALRTKVLLVFAVVVLAPSLAWYLHALDIPTAQLVFGSGQGHFFGEQGVGIASKKDIAIVLQKMSWPYFTPVVLLPGIAGAFFVQRRSPYTFIFHAWLGATAIFVCFVAGPGSTHPWYPLLFMPITAAFAAAALDFPLTRLASGLSGSVFTSLALLLVLGGVSLFALRREYKPWNQICMDAAKQVDRIAPPTGRVVVADSGDPSCLYYTKRKGWHFYKPSDDQDAIDSLERFRRAGAGWLILDNNHLWWLDYYKGFAAHLGTVYRKSIASEGQFAVFDLSGNQYERTDRATTEERLQAGSGPTVLDSKGKRRHRHH